MVRWHYARRRAEDRGNKKTRVLGIDIQRNGTNVGLKGRYDIPTRVFHGLFLEGFVIGCIVCQKRNILISSYRTVCFFLSFSRDLNVLTLVCLKGIF